MKGLFKGLKYTLSNLSKKKVTYDYPNQPLPLPDRFRGIQKFYPEKCILCDLCTEVCPTEAIVMTNNFELAEYSRDDLFKNLQWLDENDENVRKENKA